MKEYIHKVLMILFGIIVLFLIPHQIKVPLNSDVSPRAFPYAVTFLVIGISLISLIADIITHKKRSAVQSNESLTEEDHEKKSKIVNFKVILMFTITVLWIVLVPIIGFILTTFAFIMASMLIMGNHNKIQLLVVPLIFSPVVYYVFGILLKVDIPEILRM